MNILRNLVLALSYWVEFLDQLEVDKETGMVGFPDRTEGESGPFESGQLAYLEGDFSGAISLIERAI